MVKEECTQSCTHTHPAHPTLTRTRLPANPHESPPPPRRTKSSLANLFIANHSPWKLQIFNFIWHRNRWEASGSQRDKTNLGKEERREFALGPSSARDLATSGAGRGLEHGVWARGTGPRQAAWGMLGPIRQPAPRVSSLPWPAKGPGAHGQGKTCREQKKTRCGEGMRYALPAGVAPGEGAQPLPGA